MMRTLIMTSLVLVVGFCGLYKTTLGFRAFTQETARRIIVSERPRPLPTLSLQLQDGSKATLAELRGKVIVATFMYTRCLNLCSVIGAHMSKIHSDLRWAIEDDQVHFLSISFDPEVDRPEQLSGYADNFHARIENWWVARPLGDLDHILRFFGVKVIPAGQGMYVHNGAYYLIDRELRLVGIFDDNEPDAVRRAIEAEL